MMELVKPKEPLAVLCHGDFCRNNILFKYEDGKPSQVTLFDFQTVRYASPAVDLTFFCFLNTTSDFRRKHWNEMLGVYHRSLVESLADILRSSVDQVESEYSLEKIRNEFREYAFYALFLCNYFLPEMIAVPVERINHDQMAYKTFKELAEVYNKIGGDSATALVAEIVKFMAEMGAF
ncbi:hypothetical protein L9F63_016496 [Diploptera punctata]|uniref:CHK kinase-like domain-containing protein n=1 Tax=Diploptera punctata TaxID=6984 RepID=A0AAD8A0P8_DIPPU|nr:hypothetical protein L9F63_016496 [Diploptera punctata]